MLTTLNTIILKVDFLQCNSVYLLYHITSIPQEEDTALTVRINNLYYKINQRNLQ